ncbi:MAG TPA: hypothetical protein VGO93_32115, partial [Candidatus Xenobia bacterium]
MRRWWSVFNWELAVRCLPRSGAAAGNYLGLWLPATLLILVGLVVAGLYPDRPLVSTLTAVYLLYLMGNAGRLGARTPLLRRDATPAPWVVAAKLAAAALPLMGEVVLVVAVLAVTGVPGSLGSALGYLELVVLTSVLLGLNAAVRERSGLQASARTWLVTGVFLLVSAFVIEASRL